MLAKGPTQETMETKFNAIIKYLLKREAAEELGTPTWRVLNKLIIEELNKVIGEQETSISEATPTTQKKGKNKQAVVEENEIIIKTQQINLESLSEEDNDLKEGSSKVNQHQVPSIVKRVQFKKDNDPKEESSRSNQDQTTLIAKRVYVEPWKPITFLDYKDKPLPCRCNKTWLKQKAKEHFDWTHPTRRMNYHCCNCGRPTPKSETHDGWKWSIYQLCHSCWKNRSYDITEESWYNKPCKVCDQPMTERVNVSWNVDVCSEVCKYAHLAVMMANVFAHIPQKVKHYIEVKNCNEEEEEVLKAAEAYYIKLHGPVREEEYHQRYNNLETWNEAFDRLEEEYQQLGARMEEYLYNNDADAQYMDELNEAFHTNREAIINKLPRLLNLKEHPEHTHGNINLCHECLLPFNDEDLITAGNRLLCKFVEGRNEEPCYKGLEEDKESIKLEEVIKYIRRRSEEYSNKFIIYLNKNKEKTNNAWKPYTCERCKKLIAQADVRQVVKNVSCLECSLEWGKELYIQEKESGTLEKDIKIQSGGSGSRARRNERRKERQL